MSNFPTSLDNLSEVSPVGGLSLGAQNHSLLHREIHAVLNDLEAKVGIDGSAVTTSHDYKLSAITGTNRAVGRTEAATFTNKTIDADDNTIQDLALASLKTVLADASKFIVRDVNGAVTSSKAVPTGDVVGTTDGQIQVLPRLDRPYIGDFSNAGHSHTSSREGGLIGKDALATGAVTTRAVEYGAITTPLMAPILVTTAIDSTATTAEAIRATLSLPAQPVPTRVLLMGYCTAALGNGAPTQSWINRIRITDLSGTQIAGADNTKSAAGAVTETRVTHLSCVDTVPANTARDYVWTCNSSTSIANSGVFNMIAVADYTTALLPLMTWFNSFQTLGTLRRRDRRNIYPSFTTGRLT
jgi:hypothetical protein